MRNSTIISKKKKCVTCGRLEYIFSKGNCKSCTTIKSTQRRVEKYEAEIEDESLQNLIEDADQILSLYIRHLYADNKGICTCYTCGVRLPISQMQNGHYIHRTDMGTRFLTDNCRPQCPPCNSKHNDDPEPYRTKLEQERKGITEHLLELSRQVVKPTRDELKSLIAELRFKYNLVKKK